MGTFLISWQKGTHLSEVRTFLQVPDIVDIVSRRK